MVDHTDVPIWRRYACVGIDLCSGFALLATSHYMSQWWHILCGYVTSLGYNKLIMTFICFN